MALTSRVAASCLSLSSGSKDSCRAAPPSCRSTLIYTLDSLDKKQHARAVIARAMSFSSLRPSDATPASSSCIQKQLAGPAAGLPATKVSIEDVTSASMHYQLGSKIEQEEPLYGGELLGGENNYDWEELTALLSFDGEEHKYVTRHLPGAHLRVEDMFASFDGDDFEAVMTAAQGGQPHAAMSEQNSQGAMAAAGASMGAAAAGRAAHAAVQGNGSLQYSSSLDSSDEPEDLFLAVSRHRAAAMAVEAQSKKTPKPKKRKAPLGSQPSDAWMFQRPDDQSRLSRVTYEAAQRARLPPLGAQPDNGAQVTEVVVVVVQRPEVSEGAASPVPPAALQPASLAMAHHLFSSKSSSTGTMKNAVSAAAAPESLLGLTRVGAATVATQQVQPEDLRRCSSRVLAAPLAPLAAATAMMGGGLAGRAGPAEQAEARVKRQALPSSDAVDDAELTEKTRMDAV